jgi:tripartite-type tricarboxylate transporter receptor subunit TctC
MIVRVASYLLFAVLALEVAGSSAVAEQNYPNRAITLVVPFTAGGAVDLVARIVGNYASRTLGQPVVVENLPGAGGTIAAAHVARSAPDGYTILVGNLGTQVSSVGNYKNLSYDPRRDFLPVILVANASEILLVNKDLPSKTLNEFVAYTKQKGRAVTFGSAGVGSVSHLAYLLFSHLSHTNAEMVPYRGDPQADADLIAGRISAAFNQVILASSFVTSGKLRALALAAPQRSSILADVPTAAEAGMPDLLVNAWTAFFLPADTPPAIAERLNVVVQKALTDSAVLGRFADLGVEVPSPEQRSPRALEALVNSEFEKWLPLIQSAEAPAKP